MPLHCRSLPLSLRSLPFNSRLFPIGPDFQISIDRERIVAQWNGGISNKLPLTADGQVQNSPPEKSQPVALLLLQMRVTTTVLKHGTFKPNGCLRIGNLNYFYASFQIANMTELLTKHNVHSYLHPFISYECYAWVTLHWRHNESDGVSNHRRLHCLFKCWFRHRWNKHQSSASLAFVRVIHQWPLNPHTKSQ